MKSVHAVLLPLSYRICHRFATGPMAWYELEPGGLQARLGGTRSLSYGSPNNWRAFSLKIRRFFSIGRRDRIFVGSSKSQCG